VRSNENKLILYDYELENDQMVIVFWKKNQTNILSNFYTAPVSANMSDKYIFCDSFTFNDLLFAMLVFRVN